MKRLSNPKPRLTLLKCLASYSHCTDQSLLYEAEFRTLVHSCRSSLTLPETDITNY